MATETAQQKDLRREISGKVTKILNTIDTMGFRTDGTANVEIGAMIRRCVLLALRNIDDGIRMLEREIQNELNLNRSQGALIKFYMKGGNAYNCVVGTLENINNSCNVIGGGDSDWDTQVVINPWLPSPIRTRLHNEVIELAMSEFRVCSHDIARIVHHNNLDIVLDLETVTGNSIEKTADAGEVKAGKYTFILDPQQATRKVFNYDNLGMVFDDRVNLTPAPNMDPKDGPGLLFHSAIKPFELYRLGYVGKVFKLGTKRPFPAPLTDSDYDKQSMLPRKSLAELIDITIPRLGTVEAFEVWESIATNHIDISHKDINVRNLDDAAVPIPLPDINYHKLENLLMLCEMANGSSRHYNKLYKRVSRLAESCTTQVNAGQTADQVKLPLLHMVGVANEGQLQAVTASTNQITNYLQTHDNDHWSAHPNPYNQAGNWYEFIKRLMIHVHVSVSNNAANLADTTWQGIEKTRQAGENDNPARSVWADIYNTLKTQTNSHPMRVTTTTPEPSIQRFRSDDLALLDQIQIVAASSHDTDDAPLINATSLKPSTISHWRIYRVDDRAALVKIFATFKTQFNLLKSKDNTLNFVHRFYSREDWRGHLSECIVIAKKGEKILSVCTITTGHDARTGCARASNPDLELGKNTIAVLADIARQRKLTAALIHDYTLKAALSDHYHIAKQLINTD